jgi:NAD+ kinase
LPPILAGQVQPKKINRLSVEINKRRIPYRALNDILFADLNPAGTSRYTIKIDGQAEHQKSSGIWISSAAGSTAAINAAGGTIMPITSKDIQFVVREPYVEKNKIYRLTKGIVHERIELVSAMFQAGIFLDGKVIKYNVGFGDKITIRSSRKPLYLFMAE